MTTTLRARPEASEYAPFYHGYVEAVPEGDIVALLRSGGQELLEAIGRIPEDRGGFRYGPEKWSIREVLGHLIDAERIFAYRALRVGRGDHTPLASFDENEYVKTAGSDARTIADLVRELARGARGDGAVVRVATRGSVGTARGREREGREPARAGVHHGGTREAPSEDTSGAVRDLAATATAVPSTGYRVPRPGPLAPRMRGRFTTRKTRDVPSTEYPARPE